MNERNLDVLGGISPQATSALSNIRWRIIWIGCVLLVLARFSAWAAPSDWPLKPVLAGNWIEAPSDEIKSTLNDLAPLVPKEVVADFTRIERLRTLELPFYPAAMLCEGLIAGETPGIFAFVVARGPENPVVLINGTAQPIHQLNAALGVKFDTAASAMAYLQFFCALTYTKDGNFRFVEAEQDIPWAAGASDGFKEHARKVLRAPHIVPETGGGWKAKATILHAGHIFETDFRILPNGGVEMSGDKPVSHALPVSRDGFAGAIRRQMGPVAAARSPEKDAEIQKQQLALFATWKADAEAGKLDAMLAIAWVYEHGGGAVIKDEEEARKWYRKAVEAESPYGLLGSGFGLLQIGKPRIAYTHLRAVAEGADTDASASAMDALASFYKNGWEVEKNLQTAFHWSLRAAERGNENAMFEVGRSYYVGKPIKGDYKLAREWAAKAADAGHVRAMVLAGELFTKQIEDARGEVELAADVPRALRWFRQAAEAGDADGMWEIGNRSEKGFGLPKDLDQARQWYEKAAQAGHQKAKERLTTLQAAGK